MPVKWPTSIAPSGRLEKNSKIQDFKQSKTILKAKNTLVPTKLRKYKDRTAFVHVVLIETHNVKLVGLLDDGADINAFCKLKLGKQKKVSKMINVKKAKWKESFDFSWLEEEHNDLHIKMLRTADKFIGSVDVNLRELALEVTHDLWLPVSGPDIDDQAQLNIMITISGVRKPDSPTSLNNWNQDTNSHAHCEEQYSIGRSLEKIEDVGKLTVKVLEAKGLYGADWDRNSDTMAVLELNNQRVCTHTLYHTLTPSWDKIFTFNVEDINDVLEVLVNNENKNGTFASLGQVKIPLLSLLNCQRKWYRLKNEACQKRAKGKDAKILLELNLHWNPIRASVATLKPKKIKYEEKPTDTKFKLATLKRNKDRVRAAYDRLNPVRIKEEIRSILRWENKTKSTLALTGYVYLVWIFQPWMFPFCFLIPFILNVMNDKSSQPSIKVDDEEEAFEDEPENHSALSRKKSLKDQWKSLQTYAEVMQNVLGILAHHIEKIENVFNFSVPFLSFLAYFTIFLITVILYFVPLRLVLILLGIKKITKGLIYGPDNIPLSKIICFMSRVPDNLKLNSYLELEENKQTGKKSRDGSLMKRKSANLPNTSSVPSENTAIDLIKLMNDLPPTNKKSTLSDTGKGVSFESNNSKSEEDEESAYQIQEENDEHPSELEFSWDF